jgi:hypothetical protein
MAAALLPRSLVRHSFLLLSGAPADQDNNVPAVTDLQELAERCPPLRQRTPLPRPLALALLQSAGATHLEQAAMLLQTGTVSFAEWSQQARLPAINVEGMLRQWRAAGRLPRCGMAPPPSLACDAAAAAPVHIMVHVHQWRAHHESMLASLLDQTVPCQVHAFVHAGDPAPHRQLAVHRVPASHTPLACLWQLCRAAPHPRTFLLWCHGEHLYQRQLAAQLLRISTDKDVVGAHPHTLVRRCLRPLRRRHRQPVPCLRSAGGIGFRRSCFGPQPRQLLEWSRFPHPDLALSNLLERRQIPRIALDVPECNVHNASMPSTHCRQDWVTPLAGLEHLPYLQRCLHPELHADISLLPTEDDYIPLLPAAANAPPPPPPAPPPGPPPASAAAPPAASAAAPPAEAEWSAEEKAAAEKAAAAAAAAPAAEAAAERSAEAAAEWSAAEKAALASAMVNCAYRCVPFSRQHHVAPALAALLGEACMREVSAMWSVVDGVEGSDVVWELGGDGGSADRHVVRMRIEPSSTCDLEVTVHGRAQLALWLHPSVREQRLQVLQLAAPEWTYRGWLFPHDHETWYHGMYALRKHPGPWGVVEVGGARRQPGLAQCDWAAGGRTLLLATMAQAGGPGSALYTVDQHPPLLPEQVVTSCIAAVPAPRHLLYLRGTEPIAVPGDGWSDQAIVIVQHDGVHDEVLETAGFHPTLGLKHLWRRHPPAVGRYRTGYVLRLDKPPSVIVHRTGRASQCWEEEKWSDVLSLVAWHSRRWGEWTLVSTEPLNEELVHRLKACQAAGEGASFWPLRPSLLAAPELDRCMDARMDGPEHTVVPPAGALPTCGWVGVGALAAAAECASVEELFRRLHGQEGARLCVGAVF